jgi:sulfhydrogenase subunit beta (sulfur reductase)
MTMYIIPRSDIQKLYAALSPDYALFGPVHHRISGEVLFDHIEDPSLIDIDAPIPYNPPKYAVFPQAERVLTMEYNRETRAARLTKEDLVAPKALVGIRACDLTGLLCLDRFFLGQEFVDDFYLDHRKRMFIISTTCVHPFPQCFCVCTDSGPHAREGYDLNLTELGDAYLVEAGSPQGSDLVRRLGLREAGPEWEAAKAEAIDRSISLFDSVARENKAWISRVVNRITTGFIANEVWEYIGSQCFECGACSFVCPTCSCFNIEDVNTQCAATARMRTWDSCSFEGYSKMAGEHNPRRPVEDRRNKRFFCKLSFSQSKKYLRPGCVGCGRCVRVCPGDIGMSNVVTYIRREITRQV